MEFILKRYQIQIQKLLRKVIFAFLSWKSPIDKSLFFEKIGNCQKLHFRSEEGQNTNTIIWEAAIGNWYFVPHAGQSEILQPS